MVAWLNRNRISVTFQCSLPFLGVSWRGVLGIGVTNEGGYCMVITFCASFSGGSCG